MKKNNTFELLAILATIEENITIGCVEYNNAIRGKQTDAHTLEIFKNRILEKFESEKAKKEKEFYTNGVKDGLLNSSLFLSRFYDADMTRCDKKTGELSIISRKKEVSMLKIMDTFAAMESAAFVDGTLYESEYISVMLRKRLECLYAQLIYYRASLDCDDGSDINKILAIEDLNPEYLPAAGKTVSLSSLTQQLQAVINLLIDKDGEQVKVMSIDTKYMLTVMFNRSNHGAALKAVKFERFTNFILDVIARIKLGKKYEIKF